MFSIHIAVKLSVWCIVFSKRLYTLSPTDSDEYTVLEDYSPCDDDELPLAKGDTVQIVAVVLDGWWKMKKGDKIGYAPASILRRKGMDEVTKVFA